MLSRRERDILYLLAQGRTDKQIARSLGLGEATVKFHVAALSETIRAARPRPVRSRAAQPEGHAGAARHEVLLQRVEIDLLAVDHSGRARRVAIDRDRDLSFRREPQDGEET